MRPDRCPVTRRRPGAPQPTRAEGLRLYCTDGNQHERTPLGRLTRADVNQVTGQTSARVPLHGPAGRAELRVTDGRVTLQLTCPRCRRNLVLNQQHVATLLAANLLAVELSALERVVTS